MKDKSGASNYAVVDCGGGTVDIAYHSLRKADGNNYIIRELAPPSGGPFGGTLVNHAFERLLEQVFGHPLKKSGQSNDMPFINALKKQHVDVWMDLMKKFEECKTTLFGKKDSEVIRFRLDEFFSDACEDICDMGSRQLIEQCDVSGIVVERGLQIRVSCLRALFKEPLPRIIDCINQGTRAQPSIDTLYMVGSFSSSSVLYEYVCNNAARIPRQNILKPDESGLAVVKGAVLYGLNPTIIQERVSSKSYGLGICADFDASKHPQSKKIFIESTGKYYCNDVYNEFLSYGQKIYNTTTLIPRSYIPLRPDDRFIEIPVYSAPQNVKYTDDLGCQLLATIPVKMPDITGGVSRTVQVEIEFDGPEIHIVCTDETTGDSYDTSIEFNYDK